MGSSGEVEYDAIVVGAGFGGIRALWELRRQGLSVKSFEAGSDVGGAWYWNRYPGARTDSEAWVYNLNFTQELRDTWNFEERYPSQAEVQRYLSQVVDRFDLRKQIQFNTRIVSAHFSDDKNLWTITTGDSQPITCRYFIPATGPLSVGREPPFRGLKSFKGERYIAAEWPKEKIELRGKRIAIIGTGATGVQIVPKIAPVAKSLTVFQRTPNYVLPGRNYTFDEHQVQEIRKNYNTTWDRANNHGFGLAITPPGRTLKDAPDADAIKKVLDFGWEAGGFHFQFETFDDMFTSQESNEIASEYLRDKIRAVVQDQKTAELLCPKYPFLSKRPPCGHYYYEAFNRPNVELVDISKDDIELYENGIRTQSGQEYEFDMIIFAIGFDAATGALTQMDIKGSQGKSLEKFWATKLSTFAGLLVPGFPNMFLISGPHVPFGNMPVVIDLSVGWIGKVLAYLKENNLANIDVGETAVEEWSQHLDDVFKATILAESARANHAWFVGANIPGKPNNVLFYFGGVPVWNDWLRKESEKGWSSMRFLPATGTGPVDNMTEKVVQIPEIAV